MLFVRGHFFWAEVILVVNFFNLSALYFRHNTHPRLIHIPAVSGPLAWTFVALYWNGAIAVNAHTLAARILAYIAIWGILVYGLFFLVAYKVCCPFLHRVKNYCGCPGSCGIFTSSKSERHFAIEFTYFMQDYTMGFELSILTASLGVGQFFTRVIDFQWILAFVIMGVLFIATLGISIPGIFGKEISFRREGAVVPEDQERAPLLDDS
jgi:hypothetical protein